MKRALALVCMAAWVGGLWAAAGEKPEAPVLKPKPEKPPGEAKPGAKPGEPKPGAKPGDEAAAANIKEALNKKVSFDFVETPAADALAFIQAILKVNVVVSPDVDRGAPLTLRVNEMAAGNAIQWMAKLVGATMEIKDGAIFIAPTGKEGKPHKAEKAPAKFAPPQGRLVGKAQLNFGAGGSFELYLYDDDIDADTRHALMQLLHRQIAQQLQWMGKKGGADDEAADREQREKGEKKARMIELKVKPLVKEKPEKPGEGKEGQF